MHCFLATGVAAFAMPLFLVGQLPDTARQPASSAGRFDRVIAHGPPAYKRAHAAAAQSTYTTPDGYKVAVDVSSSYAAGHTPDVAHYIGLLGNLPHGSELGKLHLSVAPADEVSRSCGGGTEVLACYLLDSHTMVVPGEQPAAAAEGGYTVDYIVSHEYGHHVSAYRKNTPWDAFSYGPKYWDSQELICAGVLEHRYAPGDEGDNYASNPAENWAETYARLVYPDQPWTFDPSLKPDAAALAAARRDVEHPWTHGEKRTFSGRLSAGTTHSDSAVTLTLDGEFSVRLHGPSGANYDIVLLADGERVGASHARGSGDHLSYDAACRTHQSENVTVRIVRRSGSGPFSATVRYAG
jgi:hypothetical protein